MVEHPPLYYWLEGGVISFPGVSSLGWDLQIWLMRLVSVFVVIPIPVLCWAATRRLVRTLSSCITGGAASRYALLGAAVPLTIPNLIRDSSSVDNDSLLFLTTSVVLYGISRVLTGDLGLKTAWLISVALAAALWTKGFALALPPIVLVAYVVGALRTGQGRAILYSLWRSVLVLAAGCVVGGLWWLRNLIDYHTLQPDGFGPFKAVIRGYVDNRGTVEKFFFPFLDQFVMRIWGEIGLADLPSPGPVLVYGWFTVVTVAIVSALCLRSRIGSRRSAAVMALVPVAYLGIDIDGSYSDFHKWSHDGIQAAQGRYIYGGVVAFGALFTLGCYKFLRPRLHARIPLIVVAGAVVTNGVAWWLLLRSWYQSASDQAYVGGTVDGLRTLFRWSPLPEGVTVLLILVAPILASVGALVSLSMDLRHRPAGTMVGVRSEFSAGRETVAAPPHHDPGKG
jgi:4-amino-4-deoxy-L-arabinose transferase-like glycosyltransferase